MFDLLPSPAPRFPHARLELVDALDNAVYDKANLIRIATNHGRRNWLYPHNFILPIML